MTDEIRNMLMIDFIKLFYEAGINSSKLWTEFENEITYNNRFFPKGKLLLEIDSLKKKAEMKLHKGEKFYRARVIDKQMIGSIKDQKAIQDTIIRCYPELQGKDPLEMYYSLKNMDPMILCDEELWRGIGNVLKKSKKFWGYNAQNSDAPPPTKAKAGRANPQFISYLYLADEIKTAIYEVQPHLNQNISVATIRIDRDLKVFDFRNIVNDERGNFLTLWMLSNMFSETKTREEKNYLATQYICEYIKTLGFDGLRYRSSLDLNGNNIVLFNTKKTDAGKKDYSIINSKVYSITKHDLEYEQIAPMSNEVLSSIRTRGFGVDY